MPSKKNTIKLSLIGFLIISILSMLTGCMKENPKAYVIGFSQCTMADDWRKTMLEGMERELSFYPEVHFIMKDANGSTAKQIEQISELLAGPIDILIVSPNESKPITPVVEKAYHLGIPVVILDRKTESQKYTAYVGADNLDVGKLAGEYAKYLLNNVGNVLEVSERPGSSADIERHIGFSEAIKSRVKIQVVDKLTGDWDHMNLAKSLKDYLTSNHNIDLIFCQNDRRALTAYQVIKELGLTKKIKLIGVDGLAVKNGGIDLVESGKISATILYPTGGEEAMSTAIAILKKQPFQRDYILKITTIDFNNVRTMKLQNDKLADQHKDIERRQNRIKEQIVISKNQTAIIYTISVTLILALLFGISSFYFLRENRKINRKLASQNHEIGEQKDRIEGLAKEAESNHQEKLRFFTNISHEFRTPLTLILAPLDDILSSQLVRDGLIKQELLLIRTNTKRLLRLVNQLMDFRKLESNKMQLRVREYNIVEFVNDILKHFERVAKKRRIDLRMIVSEHVIPVQFDAGMLDKVLFNLLSNAFKFVPDGGRIYVSIHKIYEHTLEISVEDSGIGIHPEDLEFVFHGFYQGENRYKSLGTGLGLALSKELIALHHGTIVVTSQPNIKTTFTVNIPLANKHLELDNIETFIIDHSYHADLFVDDTQPFTPLVVGDSPAQEHYKQQSILIIEDNPELCKLLEQKLKAKYRIYICLDGEIGLKTAFEQIPDLILSDVMLPRQDGLSIAKILKSDFRTSHIPIVMLTAQSSMEQQIEGISVGVDAYITKPFNLQYIDQLIETQLKNRVVLREHYTSELAINVNAVINPNKLDRKFVTEFIAYVEQNYITSTLSVEVIAQDLGMSRVQLYRKVKALLGMSVNEYIQEVRLNKSKYLIRSDDFTIADVAYKVGFSSPTYFSTAFKSKFKQTPLEYKKS